MPGQEHSPDYRDKYSLADAIAATYTDGLADGQGYDTLDHDNRDYAMRRADRLEAELRALRQSSISAVT